jgi:SSS family solute:Na+ symporter
MGVIGAQMYAAGVLTSAVVGGDPRLWTGGLAAVFTAYTLLGGQHSVVRTDLLQLCFIVPGVVGATLWTVSAAGGLAGMRSALPPEHLQFPLSEAWGGADLLHLVFAVGLTYVVGPDMFSRVLSSSGAGQVRRSVLATAAALVPMALMLALIGMAGRVLIPDLAPGEHQRILALLIATRLPAWLGVLLAGALLAAFLSSADTTLLTMASTLTLDLLRLSPRVRLLRLATAGCGVASAAVGLLSGSIIDALLMAYSVFTGALAIPIIAGLIGHPLTKRGAGLCMLLGGGLALTGRLVGTRLLSLLPFAAALSVWGLDALYRRRQSQYYRSER